MTGTGQFVSGYGEAPVDLGPLDLADWHEFMHYLYLPVYIPESRPMEVVGQFALPERLMFLWDAIDAVRRDARDTTPHLTMRDSYIYVTARRGFATPGNPLNRPGWHCDDFGGTDLNYIWSDRYPTRVLLNDDELSISDHDEVSMRDMAYLADVAADLAYDEEPLDEGVEPRIEEVPVGHLLRLSPYVIHSTPVIPPPGGMRSFFKISVSSHRYNLLGNSHNHLLDYDWTMYDRAVVRNQPNGSSDYVIEERADV